VFICPECQTENRPSAKFCRKCGQERPAGVAGGGDIPETGDAGVDAAGTAERSDDAGLVQAPAHAHKEMTESAEPGRAEEPSAEGSNVVSFPGGEAVMPEPQAQPQRHGGPTCPACASNVRLSDKFCIWCGERQPQRARPKMKRCSECRTLLVLSANFCYVCGNDVGLHQRRKVRVPSELFKEDDPDLFPKFEA